MSKLTKSHSLSSHHRQIRALYDDATITLYQAYNSAIASAAVAEQRLDASPLFKSSRMTWIKPSFCWMMYRSGYSFKDANQSNVLALRMKRTFFEKLLAGSVGSGSGEAKRDGVQVRVQWDPERNARIGVASEGGKMRSIQIGIPEAWKEEWVTEGILGIEDVTDRARELKGILDADEHVTDEELRRKGLLPEERVYELPEEIAQIVRITQE